MFVRVGKMLLIIALVATLGAHWALLQTVAWTTMLADNLQCSSFRDAVAKTFDGKHPCCLCRAIAAGKKSEKKSDSTLQWQKLEYPLVKEDFAFIRQSPSHRFEAMDSFSESRIQKPPTPPPRSSCT
jgi:hypothetical protein